MRNLKKFTKENIGLATTIVLALVACMVSLILRLFTDKDLPFQIMAALIGVIITAIITQVLLNGQSKGELDKEKQAKVFEEKLRIYQQYLQTLCEVIKDHCLSDAEKTVLQFHTSFIAMHTTPEHIKRISEEVSRILEISCRRQKEEDKDDAALIKPLFNIVQCFREELYMEHSLSDKDESLIEKTIENFKYGYSNALNEEEDASQKPKRMLVDVNLVGGNILSSAKTVGQPASETPKEEPAESLAKTVDRTEWEEAVKNWKEKGWIADGMVDDKDWLSVKSTLAGEAQNPGEIEIGFYEGQYYVQATYAGDVDFSKPLKWDNGGRRSYGQWWTYLKKPYSNIAKGELVKVFNCDTELQRYLISWVDYLIEKLEQHHYTSILRRSMSKPSGCNAWIYYWHTLAIDFESRKEEGKPFFDVVRDWEKNELQIQFYNRDNNEELLKNAIERLGCEASNRAENGRFLLFSTTDFSKENVVSKINTFFAKLVN